MPELPSFAELEQIESMADVEVNYRRDPGSGVVAPVKMSEVYEGPIVQGTRGPIAGRATGSAEYSRYRRFETSGRVVTVK